MRIIEPEKEAVCTSCGTRMLYTKEDILYSYYVDDWRYKTTWEIHGYVNCPKCHKDQYIGILVGDTDLTEEQFREKYKGHIYGETPAVKDQNNTHEDRVVLITNDERRMIVRALGLLETALNVEEGVCSDDYKESVRELAHVFCEENWMPNYSPNSYKVRSLGEV